MDPRWIGAWWTGYVGLAALFLLPALLFYIMSRPSQSMRDDDSVHHVDRHYNPRHANSVVTGVLSCMCTSAFAFTLLARVFTTTAEVATENLHVNTLYGRSSYGNKGEEITNSERRRD